MRENYGIGPCRINYSITTTNRGFELGTFQIWQFTTFYHVNGQLDSNFTPSNFGLILHYVRFFMDYTITYNIFVSYSFED